MEWIVSNSESNISNGQNTRSYISAAVLHIFAMGLMLCDHLWAMLFPAQEWLTCAGRIAFPIFAFMIVEGYLHTHDLRRYFLRLLLGALLSEIPFNLMYAGSIFYPYHQNVLWTFLISLLLIVLIERSRSRLKPIQAIIFSAVLTVAGFLLGYIAMTDYYGVGVLTVLTFYFFRTPNWKNRLCQLVCLYILHIKILGGYYYSIRIFAHDMEIVQQGFALLALIPIWLYKGKQGFHNKAFQYFCYVFYPAHMLILFLIREWVLNKGGG